VEKFYDEYLSLSDEDRVTFTPHYVTWPCHTCKVAGWVQPVKDCLSGGRYCATDPGSFFLNTHHFTNIDGVGKLTGSDIVIESLRQICIFQGDILDWWKYMIAFNEYCIKEKEFNT